MRLSDVDFDQFVRNVYKKTRIDLSHYKEKQMKRRLTSLRDKHGYTSFADYFQALLQDSQLFHEFIDRLTINVSEFFRNIERWDVLEQKILPDLLKNQKRLKIWSAAASTGEEPYSLVLLLNKFLPLRDIHVTATDIDEDVMQKAKDGKYIERSIKNVPPEFMTRYFKKEDISYTISEDIKSKVTFSKHNLLEDSFSTHFDLIVCRNVIIYFTEEAKINLFHKFGQALKPGGILFVGSTEQIFHPEEYGLQSIDSFFYKKI